MGLVAIWGNQRFLGGLDLDVRRAPAGPVLLLRVARFVSRVGCIIQGSAPGLSVVLLAWSGKSPPRASCFNLLISSPWRCAMVVKSLMVGNCGGVAVIRT